MKKSLKFRTMAGILAWIIALGTVPPVVSSANEIEEDPPAEVIESVAADYLGEVDDETEPEETELDVTEPEKEDSEDNSENTFGEGASEDNSENTSGEDAPEDNSEETSGEGGSEDNSENTSGEGAPEDNSEETSGEGAPEDNSENTSGEGAPEDNSENTSGEGAPEDNSENTSGEDVPEDNSENTSGEDAPEDNSENTSGEGGSEDNSENTSGEDAPEDNSEGTSEEEPQPEESSLYEQLLVSETLTEMYDLLTAEENAETLLQLTEEEIAELLVKADGLYEMVEPYGEEFALYEEIVDTLNELPNAPESVPEENPEEENSEEDSEELGTAQEIMAEFAAAVELFPDEADFILYDEENNVVTRDDEAYYRAYAAFYEENPDIWATTDELYNEASEAFAAENPEGDLDKWLLENGFWEAVEKFCRIPAPEDVEAMIAQYEEAEEIELEFTVEEEAPVLYGTAESADGDKTVVANGGGIKFHLFNYSNEINKTDSNNDNNTKWRQISSYFTFRGNNSTVGDSPSDIVDIPKIDDDAIKNGYDDDGYLKTHATVERKLDSPNGYPVLELTKNADGTARTDPNLSAEVRSLKYLFYEPSTDHAVTAYTPINTILQRDGNHYYYNSSNNAVDYDTDKNTFRVRSYTERTKSTAGYSGYSDFLPFNYTNGVNLKDGENGLNYHLVPHNENTSGQYPEADYWFGMTMEIDFFMTKDGMIVTAAGSDGELGTEDDVSQEMIFQFSGDDDVWVFVDDVLVLDLGGTHGTVDGSINFATGEVLQYLSWGGANSTDVAKTTVSSTSFPTTLRACFDAAKNDEGESMQPVGGWNTKNTEDDTSDDIFADYTQHTLKFFYLERGSAVANCKLDFYLPTLPENSLTVTKVVEKDDNSPDAEFIADSLEYQFKVWEAKEDENGELVATNDLFIKPGTKYDVLDESSNDIGDGVVDGEGCFTLKAGQSAQFLKMLEQNEGKKYYVVEEILPNTTAGQYGEIQWEVDQIPGTVKPDEGEEREFTSVMTGGISAESTQTVKYKNKVNTEKLSKLRITKEVSDGSTALADKEFQFKVMLGDELLPKGTEYTVDGETCIVDNADGIIILEDGETAEIPGIISGTKYTITEVLDNLDADLAGKTLVFYNQENSVNVKKNDRTAVDDSTHFITGEFPLASIVYVTATNSTYNVEKTYDLYIAKQVTGNMGDQSKAFDFTVTMELPVQASMDELTVYAVDEAEVLYSIGSANDIVQTDANDIAADSDKKLEFILKHDEKYHVTGIPNGATITITEDESANGYSTEIGYYEVDQNGQLVQKKNVTIDGTTNYPQTHEDERTVVINSFTADYDDGYIIFTNTKTATIDTAVHLDYLPYIILFAIVGTGVIIAASDKRREADE